MATGGPEPGPSESSRSCDLSLHDFSEQPWSVFAANFVQDQLFKCDDTQWHSKSCVHRFDSNYMGVFGFFPDKEDFVTVVCDECNKIVIPYRIKQHVMTYHSSDNKINRAVHNSQNDSINTHVNKNEYPMSSKTEKHSSEVQRVRKAEDRKPFIHLSTYKNYPRSSDFSIRGFLQQPWSALAEDFGEDHVFNEDKTKKHRQSYVHRFDKEFMSIFGFFPDKEYFVTVACDTCNKIILPHRIHQHVLTFHNSSKTDFLPKTVSNSPNDTINKHVNNKQEQSGPLKTQTGEESKPTIRLPTCKNSSWIRHNILTHNKPLHKLMADISPINTVQSKEPKNNNISRTSYQESSKPMPSVKVVKSNFSLPLTLPLSCISDLSVLKPSNSSIFKSSVSTTTVTATTASITVSNFKKQEPAVATAAITTTAPLQGRPASTTPTIHAVTHAAVNPIRLRNNNQVYVNVFSVDYEQNMPKPSAVCTFGGRKIKNQIVFTPKYVLCNDAFRPVTNYFPNHVPNQPHSRPPLVSNYNLTNSMNGPQMHMQHSTNGYNNYNPFFAQTPPTPVSPLKPVIIGAQPNSYKPLLPKAPQSSSQTPYNFQYQNGYTNGVGSPPPSLATTSLKRLNPFATNNNDDTKHSRSSLATAFLIDDEDELPNGKTDLTTLMELEFDDP